MAIAHLHAEVWKAHMQCSRFEQERKNGSRNARARQFRIHTIRFGAQNSLLCIMVLYVFVCLWCQGCCRRRGFHSMAAAVCGVMICGSSIASPVMESWLDWWLRSLLATPPLGVVWRSALSDLNCVVYAIDAIVCFDIYQFSAYHVFTNVKKL